MMQVRYSLKFRSVAASGEYPEDINDLIGGGNGKVCFCLFPYFRLLNK